MAAYVYDPPVKGKEIVSENQKDHSVYVLDSFPRNEKHLRLYDTSIDNNRMHILRQENFIPEYSVRIYFISDYEIGNIKILYFMCLLSPTLFIQLAICLGAILRPPKIVMSSECYTTVQKKFLNI